MSAQSRRPADKQSKLEWSWHHKRNTGLKGFYAIYINIVTIIWVTFTGDELKKKM